MERTPAGFRLRQTRRERGMTQAALAAAVGISPSYLNLIEQGKRRIAGALLRRLADALGLDMDEITGAETSRLVQDLTEITADPLLRDLAIDPGSAQEIVGRQPAWGRAVVRLHRSYRQASVVSETLADRLAHDSGPARSEPRAADAHDLDPLLLRDSARAPRYRAAAARALHGLDRGRERQARRHRQGGLRTAERVWRQRAPDDAGGRGRRLHHRPAELLRRARRCRHRARREDAGRAEFPTRRRSRPGFATHTELR